MILTKGSVSGPVVLSCGFALCFAVIFTFCHMQLVYWHISTHPKDKALVIYAQSYFKNCNLTWKRSLL